MITLSLGPFTVFYINLRNAYRAQQEYNRLLKSNSTRISELKSLRDKVKEILRQVVSRWKDQLAGVSR